MIRLKSFALVTTLLSFATLTHATQPPDVVQSDNAANTAAGSFALQSMPSNDVIVSNTAVGFSAMMALAGGLGNTAIGAQTLQTDTNPYFDIAVGYLALGNAQGSDDDVAIGVRALQYCHGCTGSVAVGTSALAAPQGGWFNIAIGYSAMGQAAGSSFSAGSYNTAVGAYSLNKNQGGFNVATGYQALAVNEGDHNTASGASALFNNTTGYENTATGANALYSNTTGYDNVASGQGALRSNATGYFNTASGEQSLFFNASGNENTASGSESLYSNVGGSNNTAVGSRALYSNVSGINNTAVGKETLASNSTGSQDVALGFHAGYNITGSNDIAIGNDGMAGESGTIRIGTPGTHMTTYIAGIFGTPVTGNAVVISATGQLGVVVSSERFKTAIVPMTADSERFNRLRPVSFHLKTDPEGPVQYGLIAEEVARVYPELVIHGLDGSIDGVRYDELAPLLINEVQDYQRRLDAGKAQLAAQADQLRRQRERLAVYDAKLAAIERGFQSLRADRIARQPGRTESSRVSP